MRVGKISIVAAIVLAIAITPLLGIGEKGGLQFIQEYTGFVSSGVFAMFIMGFLWKKTTSNAALFATIGGFLLSVLFKFLPQWADLSFLAPIGFAAPNGDGIYEIPFLDRMGIVFILCIIGMVAISLIETARGVQPKGLEIDTRMFRVSNSFLVGSLIVLGVLTALYTVFY